MIEKNSNRVVVSNMASTLKDLIDGKCHTETSLEMFIYRKISFLSKNSQMLTRDRTSWSRFKPFEDMLFSIVTVKLTAEGLELLNIMSE